MSFTIKCNECGNEEVFSNINKSSYENFHVYPDAGEIIYIECKKCKNEIEVH